MSTRLARSKAHSRRIQGGGLTLTNKLGRWDASIGNPGAGMTDLIGSNNMTPVTISNTTINGRQAATRNGSDAGTANGRFFGNNPLTGLSVVWYMWVGSLVRSAGLTEVYVYSNITGGAYHTYDNNTNWIAAGISSTTIAASDALAHVFYVEYNGANTKSYIDGSLRSTTNPGSAAVVDTVLTFLNVKNSGLGVGNDQIKLGEVMVGGGTNPHANIVAESAVWKAKWGTP